MIDLSGSVLVLALLGSLLPAFFWLWFWSRQDRFCPEPRIHLFAAFIFGALAALFALPAQSLVASIFGAGTVIAMVLFVSTEEYIKYLCCWYSSMRSNPYYNERIDPIIYLATTALGFSTLENILYFLQYLNDFNLDIAAMEGGKRIIGATILHMATSSIVGIFMAFVYFKSRLTKLVSLIAGLITAIVVHIGFNHLVLHSNSDLILIAFSATWFLFMLILVTIELLRSPTCPPDIDWNNYEF